VSAVVENKETEQRDLHSSSEIKNLTLIRLPDVFKCGLSTEKGDVLQTLVV
jgi:hypothetical protein